MIFDNILICASGYDELYLRMDIALDLCIKYNVTLKMGKTWLGFPEVKFFGYVCRKGSYELAAERKEALNQIPFHTNTKSMQRFLGFALFFKPFVSQYSVLAAPLNDMVHKDFDWDPKSWKTDYQAVWKAFKDACNNCMGLHYNIQPFLSLSVLMLPRKWGLVLFYCKFAQLTHLSLCYVRQLSLAILLHDGLPLSKNAMRFILQFSPSRIFFMGLYSPSRLIITISDGWNYPRCPRLCAGVRTCNHSNSWFAIFRANRIMWRITSPLYVSFSSLRTRL